MFLLWLLIPTTGGIFLDENQSTIFQNVIPALNFTGINAQCQNDTVTWTRSILLFADEFNSCVLNNSTGQCSLETKKEMMKNFYGLKQLDAFGRTPSGILDIKTTAYGDLQECQEVSKHFYYPTKYCLIHSELAMKGQGTCANEKMSVFRTAVCMPKSCTDKDILILFDQVKNLGLMNHCSVSCKKEKGKTDTFTWIFLAFMSFLVGLLLIASILDYILETYYQLKSQDAQNPALRAVLVFSIYTNGGLICNTTPPREGHLKCLDCIRFLSMIWVAAGHIFNFTIASDSIIPLLSIPKPILADTLMSSFFSVDTFFVISGLLVSYLFFKAVAKNPRLVKSPLTWILFYVHRYFRLTPPYMLFICFFMVVTPLMTGILMTEWDVQDNLVRPCQQNWWKNMLYINNFGSGPPCYGISWYLSNDTQMFLVAPLFLFAFYFSVWLGLGAVTLGCLGSSVVTIIITIHYNLPATAARPEKAEQFNDYIYEKPWIRCPPYLIGIAAGYFLAKYPNWRPKVHRVGGLPRLQILFQLIALLGWMVSIALALAIIYGPHDYLALETNWAKGVRGFYNAGSRIGWAFFIVWVVMANQYGYGGPIASFMEHPIWQPFGRLSYTAYLCHMFLIYYLWNLQDRPPHFDGVWSQFIQRTIPVVVMAYFFAFFWSCLTEIPFLKLEKMLFDAIIPTRRVNEKTPEKKTVEAWND